MGSKSNPGKFDCYAKAEPDEPVFVLLGRDPVAHILVEDWATLRERLGKTEAAVLKEARQCALAMFDWALAKGKGEQQEAAEEARRATVKAWRDQGARRKQAELQHEYDAVYERNKTLTAELLVDRDRVRELEAQEARNKECVNIIVDTEVTRLRERVRELEKERDEDRDRYDTTVGHVRVLEAQCRSAADVVRHCVAINDSDGGMRDRDELLQLEKELREADPRARIEEGSRLLKLQALCHRAAEIVAKQTLAKAITGAFPFSLVGEQGRKELDDLVKELRGA